MIPHHQFRVWSWHSKSFQELFDPQDIGFVLCGADGLEAQLSTGLKDKNGNKIYEGDILHYCPSYSESQGGQLGADIGEVYWDTDGWRWEGQYLGENAEFTEIIGNIFENPELK